MDIAVSRSRLYGFVLFGLLGLLLLVALALPWHPLWSALYFGLAILLTLHAWYAAQQGAVSALRCSSATSLMILDRPEGDWVPYERNGAAFVHPWLLVVPVQETHPLRKRRVRYLFFLPDQMTAEVFRRFRIWLLWSTE